MLNAMYLLPIFANTRTKQKKINCESGSITSIGSIAPPELCRMLKLTSRAINVKTQRLAAFAVVLNQFKPVFGGFPQLFGGPAQGAWNRLQLAWCTR